MPNPLVLTNLSKAGGVGKTTIAVNLAYEWSLRGLSVGIIDLDSNHTLDEFVGIEPEPEPENTSVVLFDKDFDGEYNFKNALDSKELFVCQGHDLLEDVSKNIVSRKRREYILKKVLTKFPPQLDLIIFDCAGGLDILTENALAASTHVIVPVHIGVKALSVASLITNIYSLIEDLEIEPVPEILGLLPNHFNQGSANHVGVLEAVIEEAKELNLKVYPPIKTWQYLNNSALYGKALKQLRSKDPMAKIFAEIVNDLSLEN